MKLSKVYDGRRFRYYNYEWTIMSMYPINPPQVPIDDAGTMGYYCKNWTDGGSHYLKADTEVKLVLDINDIPKTEELIKLSQMNNNIEKIDGDFQVEQQEPIYSSLEEILKDVMKIHDDPKYWEHHLAGIGIKLQNSIKSGAYIQQDGRE